MSLPALSRLRLTSTGEFFPLSRKKANKLNRDGNVEPITAQPFQRDAEPHDGWHSFRVKLKKPDGTYVDQFYRAESLWNWYQSKLPNVPTDPVSRQPAWYEDWWELKERFDPRGAVPAFAHTLTMLDPTTAVRRHLARRTGPPVGPAQRPAPVRPPAPPLINYDEPPPDRLLTQEEVDGLLRVSTLRAVAASLDLVRQELIEAQSDMREAQEQFREMAELEELDAMRAQDRRAATQERRFLATRVIEEILQNPGDETSIQDRLWFISALSVIQSNAWERTHVIRHEEQRAAAPLPPVRGYPAEQERMASERRRAEQLREGTWGRSLGLMPMTGVNGRFWMAGRAADNPTVAQIIDGLRQRTLDDPFYADALWVEVVEHSLRPYPNDPNPDTMWTTKVRYEFNGLTTEEGNNFMDLYSSMSQTSGGRFYKYFFNLPTTPIAGEYDVPMWGQPEPARRDLRLASVEYNLWIGATQRERMGDQYHEQAVEYPIVEDFYA